MNTLLHPLTLIQIAEGVSFLIETTQGNVIFYTTPCGKIQSSSDSDNSYLKEFAQKTVVTAKALKIGMASPLKKEIWSNDLEMARAVSKVFALI